MLVRMDWKGERYQWVLENNIEHIVLEEVISPISFRPMIFLIDIPDNSQDAVLFTLRWA